ncbi:MULTISPECIES: LysR family transcriptional regulator [unclassified Sphingomonas]|uniref:LysR family transcriptional regulator n=1 Tax=unclassified Sphingomonas TaxID=196159 RepID=UPI00082A8E5A|nr:MULTISPECIES: LysR family transcriptional regulator [unclassified Sphingomonas]
MEMHQIRYFLAVARTLNFTRAAEECNVTQPSLTRAVQKLEDELGDLLFRRERALTHLTDLGRAMLPHLEQTYEAAQAAKALAKGIGKAQVSPLNLGIASGVESGALYEVLNEVGSGLEGFELNAWSGRSAELLEQAMRGDLDLLIVEAPQDAHDRLDHWPLFTQRYHFVTRRGHAFEDRAAVAVADLGDEDWIDCLSDGTARLRAAAARTGAELKFRHRAPSHDQVRQMMLAGLGSAVLPRPDPDEPRLVALAFMDEGFEASVVLAGIAGRRRSPAAEAFARAARARLWPDR